MISVCMATYNGERFLRRQLETILSQLGDGDELVISDDSSTDSTPALLTEYAVADPRIRSARMSRISGRERCMRICSDVLFDTRRGNTYTVR
jgi:glycosyltransferase involved in cell wall biosynthesis